MKHIITSFLLMLVVVFTAQSQALVSVTPSTGAVGTTVPVTITGSRTTFTNTTNFALSLGTSVIPLTNVVALSATSATASVVIPANAASGAYTLVAVMGLSLPLQLPGAFTVTGGAPVAGLVSISPNSGNKGQSLLVTITGVNTNFTQSSSTTVTLTSMGGGGTPIVTPTAFAQSNTTLRTLISIPSTATAGAYALVVSTSNDGTLILPNAFTVGGGTSSTPKLSTITPSSAKRGQTLNVTITGTNTSFMQSSDVTVSLFSAGSPLAANFAFANSNTSITANFTIPVNQTLGLHDLYVLSTEDGLLSLPASFNVTSTGGGGGTPELVSVSPPYGHKGQTLNVTITGTNTRFMQGSQALAIYNNNDGVEATSQTVISDTEIIGVFSIPATWTNGLYTIGVMNDMNEILELPSSFAIVSVGVNELTSDKHGLNVYPNPVNTQLTFESVHKVTNVAIIDITGKLVQVSPEALAHPDSKTYLFDFNRLGLKKGIYFLRVETDQNTLYQKFISE
ncbi:MAG: T9SS type A sorting domain-containing protein [Bacteroidota bacterium]